MHIPPSGTPPLTQEEEMSIPEKRKWAKPHHIHFQRVTKPKILGGIASFLYDAPLEDGQGDHAQEPGVVQMAQDNTPREQVADQGGNEVSDLM